MRYLVLILWAGSLFADTVPGRYIVELSAESVVEHAGKGSRREILQSAEAHAQRGRVRAQQREMRNRMPGAAVVLNSVENVANALFIQMTEDEAKQMASAAGVRRILPVRTLHRILDRAVAVNGIVDAWNQLPPDSAGAGVKVAIIDSGIDVNHPAFQDMSLQAPDGFPKASSEADRAYTNNKVLVARSYVGMLPRRDTDLSARDRVGHGTALAMIVAGVRTTGPLATIAGAAPKAWLGNYKVFGTPGINDTTTDDAVLKALDDAVADGMDIVNLSLGYDIAPRLEDDPEVAAIERATRAGVIVVAAAGNNGPQSGTVASPATAPSAIAAGATHNDRTFASKAVVQGVGAVVAVNADNVAQSTPTVTGVLFDAGLACDALPSGSAQGRVALILRGACTFESKLNNAQRAGAAGALVYAAEAAPDPFTMSVGSATLPAQMIGYRDGVAAKAANAAEASLYFAVSGVGIDPNRMADFSAAGPNVDASVKPDLVAVGADMYVATQTIDPRGDMYDPSGFLLVDGTSFSSPLVAGAAAVLKSARPGLTVDQYRSLLINGAAPWQEPLQRAGAGRLNLGASLRSTATVSPAILNFGGGTGNPDMVRTLKLTNTGAGTEVYSIVVEGPGPSPTTGLSAIEVGPGASVDVPVSWRAAGLEDGAYQGFLRITGTSGSEIRVPWWYGATSGRPERITVLYSLSGARRNSTARDAVLFRVVDAAGLPVETSALRVTAIAGNGSVQAVRSRSSVSPGLYGVQVRLGPAAGANVFRIQAGDAVAELTIAGN